jgi:putative transposase
MVRKRGGRKQALRRRAPMALPQAPNKRWCLDFLSDALACGRKFQVRALVDDFDRECPAPVVDNSQSSIRVARSTGSSRCVAHPASSSATTAQS